MRALAHLTLLMILATSAAAVAASASGDSICAFGMPDSDASSTTISTFEPGSPAWEFTAPTDTVAWHASSKTGKNAANDATTHSQPWRLYYGSNDPSRQDYSTGQVGNSGTATSPSMHVPENSSTPTLVFLSKHEVEARRPATHDQMLVYTSMNNGAWQLLCRISPTTAYNGDPDEAVCSRGTQPQGAYPCPSDSTGTLPEWGARVIPLSGVVGANVRVRFQFESVDSNFNHAMGWMIDDVRITYHAPTPPPPSVQSPYACSDGKDNDNDGQTDYPNDPGCSAPWDQTEAAECSDGLDNDSDGKTDYPNDPGCESASDNSESPDPQDPSPPQTPFMTKPQLALLGIVFLVGGAFLTRTRKQGGK